METGTGIGGVFFRSKDPTALAKWYEGRLGIGITPASYDESPWLQQSGPTVIEPFPAESDYLGRAEQAWMPNFRVDDLDAMAAQPRNAGMEVKVDPEEYPNGRFDRTHDPDGNPVELWEPRDPHE